MESKPEMEKLLTVSVTKTTVRALIAAAATFLLSPLAVPSGDPFTMFLIGIPAALAVFFVLRALLRSSKAASWSSRRANAVTIAAVVSGVAFIFVLCFVL